MPTPQQVLVDARWILDNTPGASEAIYAPFSEHWYIRMGDEGSVSTGFKTLVQLKDVASLARATANKIEAPREYMTERAHSYVTFSRAFAEHPKVADWMKGAAWIVLQALDVKFVGADDNCFRWYPRTGAGNCVLSNTVVYRETGKLRTYLNNITGDAETPVTWINREFLEDWAVCEIKGAEVPVTKAPEAPVKVTATVTTSALPTDLQGAEKFRGLTLAERRQSHARAILEDMMTRTAPPRYK